MKRIDRIISDACVWWLLAGDFHEWMFGSLNGEYMVPVETWNVNCSHCDYIVNVDIMTTASRRYMKIIE